MNTEKSGIYLIRNMVNGKIYIGSAINISNRFKEHIKRLNSNQHENKHLQNAWNKYGKDNFKFEIKLFCVIDELIIREQEQLDKYSKDIGWDQMFNINHLAASSLGMPCSEETKRKISISQSGRIPSLETRKLLSDALKGREVTDEHKAKLVNSPRFMGCKHTSETKEKIRNAMKIVASKRTRNKTGIFVNVDR